VDSYGSESHSVTAQAHGFIVRVEARNLVLVGESQAARRQGCHSDRLVEADSPEDAAEAAMLQVWEDATLRAQIENEEDDPPLLYVSEAVQLGASELPPSGVGEYAFFPEEPIDLGALLGED
jgi:hypothetical protein